MNVPANITVFLIESRSFYRDLFLQSFGKLGLKGKCIISKSFDESIRKLESVISKGVRVDLIIIEAELPGEEKASLKLIKLIRSKNEFESAGVLLISAEDDAQNVVEAFEEGADSYAFKPLNDQMLKEKIEHCWLKRKRLAKVS